MLHILWNGVRELLGKAPVDNREFLRERAPPQAPEMPGSRQWTRGQIIVLIVQAIAIGGLTWMMLTPIGYPGEKPPPPAPFVFAICVVIVAFTTA